MLTLTDEKKGLVKTDWATLRDRFFAIKPELAQIIDSLSPDQSYPLYLAYYPYGDVIGDTETVFLPKLEGGSYRLTDAPSHITEHLGYGATSSPLGIVLEKQFEQYIDLPEKKITIPWSMYEPGAFVSFRRNLSRKDRPPYTPNNVLSAVSGARSVFVLPSVGCAINYASMQRDFNLKTPVPKSLYEHFGVFKEIINSSVVDSDWRSCLVYFSEKWIQKIHNDPAWLKLKLYIYEFAWQRFEYEMNRVHYDFIFSLIQSKRNLKPNPYLADTARHLFAIAVGGAPAYAPCESDAGLPKDLFQEILINSYGLKKYLPSIIFPKHFDFFRDKDPVYYSLQNPSTTVFSPRSRKNTSTLSELRELAHLIDIFMQELTKEREQGLDSILYQVTNHVAFRYFHNEEDLHKTIYPSTEIATLDKRFYSDTAHNFLPGAKFAADGTFVRGCISISPKNSS
jgi:hypothetical protein